MKNENKIGVQIITHTPFVSMYFFFIVSITAKFDRLNISLKIAASNFSWLPFAEIALHVDRASP